MAQKEIVKAKGIRVSTPNGDATEVYGGYPYSVQYSINFTSPSKMTISFVSEDGEYNEDGLKKRIFPGNGDPTVMEGGAISTDSISFGTEFFNMHPVRYTIKSGAQGRFLDVEYYDKSIILDKVIVALKGKHYPPIHLPKYLGNYGVGAGAILEDRTFIGGIPKSPYIIGLGNPYLRKGVVQDSGVLAKPDKDKISSYTIPEYLYTPYELYLGIINNGALAGMLDPSVKLLWWLAQQTLDANNGLAWGNTNNDDEEPLHWLRNYHGTLREVLSAWAKLFGFLFYWESQQGADKLAMMDLRGGIAFANISDQVERFITTADSDVKGLIQVSHAHSIEDTLSKGAAGYLGINGEDNQIAYTTNLKPLDLFTLPIWNCNTEKPFSTPEKKEGEIDCVVQKIDDEAGNRTDIDEDSDRFALEDYCWEDDDYTRPFSPIDMSSIRSTHKAVLREGAKTMQGAKTLTSYVRLLKASLLGPEFFRAFVLLKKASSSYANEPFKVPKAYKGVPLNKINNYGFDVQQIPLGKSFLDPNVDKDKNQIVNLIYTSGGKPNSGFENEPGYYNKLCYPSPLNHVGQGAQVPFEPQKLEDQNLLASVNYTIGRDCISIQRVNSKQFERLLFFDDRIRQQLGVGGTVDTAAANKGRSPEEDTGHLAVYRLKKYGNAQLIQNPSEDHIYKLLNGIATNQGRFYYHPAIIKQQVFSERNYIDKGIQWIYRYTCTQDSVFSDLQQAIDPNSDYRRKTMPSSCVQYKNRQSEQKDAKGIPFKEGNFANLTVEQFIHKIYAEEITGAPPEEQATLVVSTLSANGGITQITIVDGGAGYKDGTINLRVVGANTLPAEVTAEVSEGVIIQINIDFTGEGYTQDDVSVVVSDPTANGEEHNVFGQRIACTKSPTSGKTLKEGAGAECKDCITSSNLSYRNAQYTSGEVKRIVRGKKVCTPPDEGGVLVKDSGINSPVVPAAIEALIEKYIKAFYVIPATFPLDLVQFHDENDLQLLVLPAVGKVPEAEERKQREVDPAYQPQDELDWIIDQIDVPNLDILLMQDKESSSASKNSWYGKDKLEDPKVRNKDLNAIQAVWYGKGPKFEKSTLIEPIFSSNVVRVDFEELTPSEEDLGVEEAQCLTINERAKKIKKDQKKINENMRDYVEAHVFHQGEAQFNAKLSVHGNGLTDKNDTPIDLRVQDGLEGITAQLDGDGIVFEYILGTKRKRRILEFPRSDQWVRVKPELFNNVFDI